MPQRYDPPRGWVGTCNHYTVNKDYPYHYSSHASPSFRYRRLCELLDNPAPKRADDHWRFQRDTLNLMARDIAPVMSRALLTYKDTETLGRILAKWNFEDALDQAAPAIFQSVYRHFAFAVFEDELSEQITAPLMDNPYFWQERLRKMILDGDSPWFDDTRTADIREGG